MPTWLPWVIMFFGLAIGVGLIIYNVVRDEGDDVDDANADTLVGGRKEDPFAKTADERLERTAEAQLTARKSRMLALKQSLENSLQTRAGTRPATDRMLMPWFLLVGPEGSGKTTLLENTGLPLPYGPSFEVDSKRKDAGRWWLFEEAVVLEAPPAAPAGPDAGLTLGKTLPPDRSEGWNTLLHMLRRERPDSPLNGIIVTIACSDLIDARRKPQQLEEQADRIRAFLERTRRVLGVRLPLHVLVTKCDALPGFRSLANNLPQARRHDIFGWANDANIEAPFDASWVDNGFATLRTSLEELRDEVLAAPEELRDSDGLFVFPHEFSDVREPLREFIARLMPGGSRRPSLFFRGMYFCGESIDPAAIPGFDDSGKLVFLRSLFRDKIFPEAGMARPVARVRVSRDRRVVLAQAAALIFTLIGGAGLWATVNGFTRGSITRTGLHADAEALTRVLSGMVIDLDQVKRGTGNPDSSMNRRTRDAAAIELVGEMRDVEALHRSPFIPVSWFSSLPGEIRRSMVVGIQDIVLPVIRQRLQERADRLLAGGAAGGGGGGGDSTVAPIADDLEAVDARALTSYLSDVRTLSRNIGRYNTLAASDTGSVADLSVLLDYLFGERLESDSGRRISDDFEHALRMAQAPRIIVSANRAADVLNRSVAIVSAVAGAASRQLAPRPTLQAELRVNPNADMLALRGLAAIVELSHPTRGLKATLSDSTILGLPLTSMIEDSIGVQLRLAAARIARDTLPPEQQGQRLRTVIENLSALRFMERSEGRDVVSEIRPNARLRWDVGRLELALTLRGEFDQAVVTVGDAFPDQSPDRMRRALEVQLRARAIDVAASAQRFTPNTSGADAMVDARASAANLDAAASRIVRLAELLDSLRAAPEGRKLLASGTRQAEQVLATAQGVVDRQRYFAPQASRIASWQGVIPISYAAFGVTDSISFETLTVQHLTAVRTLAHDVAPALRYLRMPAIDSTRAQRLVDEWEALATAVAKYERGDPTSTLGILHRFLRDELNLRDINACRAAAVPDSAQPAADILALRRRQFRAAVASRCANGGADAVRRYQRLSSAFTRHLAGRFPFADSGAVARTPRAASGDPGAIREFFRAYDVFTATGDVALRSDPRLAGAARGALGFLDQMAQVRAFLAPMLRDGDRSLPRYSLLVSPADTMVDVELHIGGRTLPLDEAEREAAWRYGDTVRVTLEDASDDAVFSAVGGWSVLQLVRRGAGQVNVRVFHPDTKLELVVPSSFPTLAPEIALPRPRPPLRQGVR